MGDYLAKDGECLRQFNLPVMQAIVKTESSFNPFAIGVVNARLDRQPSNKEEAIATALSLKEKGFNYSMGLAQVNQANLAKYGLNHETVFEPCRNLQVGVVIFNECHDRAVRKFGNNRLATNAALSCYYSGNFTRGQLSEGNSPSYVHKVINNMAPQAIHVTPIKTVKKTAESKTDASRSDGVGTKDVTEAADTTSASWDVFREF